MGLNASKTYDFTGEDYKPGPRKAKLTVIEAEPFEGQFEKEAIKVVFEEEDTSYNYSEIFSVSKHPDAKINGLLRAAFKTTDVKFKLKDLVGKTVVGYIYTKESGYKGVKFEQNGDEY